MRKIVFIACLFLFITTNTMAQDIGSDELVDIASFVTNHELKVDQWEVTMKEKIDKGSIPSIIKTLSASYTVKKTADKNSVKYFFTDAHNSADVTVFYNVIIPKDGRYNAELTAVIAGSGWDESVKSGYKKKQDLISHQLFTESVKTYTCLTTQDDAIIDSDSFLREFAYYLNLQHEETQFDTVRNSTHEKVIYGYTSLWNQKFSINGTKMNVQIAVTNGDNGNPKYTIGTPILINEY